MESQLTVVGVKQFKGEVEGTQYDQTKLIVLLPFPKARASANIGYDAVPAQYGTFENFKKFEGRKYPLVITAEYEVTTKGIELYEVTLPPLNAPQK